MTCELESKHLTDISFESEVSDQPEMSMEV